MISLQPLVFVPLLHRLLSFIHLTKSFSTILFFFLVLCPSATSSPSLLPYIPSVTTYSTPPYPPHESPLLYHQNVQAHTVSSFARFQIFSLSKRGLSNVKSTFPSASPPPRCQLLGHFSMLVQAALGITALLSLVYKRWTELPQRPVRIWFFDVSKQVIGSFLLHFINLAMSIFNPGFDSHVLHNQNNLSSPQPPPPNFSSFTLVARDHPTEPNPCSYYLLNLLFDTTIGIPILMIWLRIFHNLFLFTPLAHPEISIASGVYSPPPTSAVPYPRPRASWWLKQCLIYFLGLVGMKLCSLIFFKYCPWIVWFGDWALRWTQNDSTLQIIFVMFIFPVILNACQYWIIDSFIKTNTSYTTTPATVTTTTTPTATTDAFHHDEATALTRRRSLTDIYTQTSSGSTSPPFPRRPDSPIDVNCIDESRRSTTSEFTRLIEHTLDHPSRLPCANYSNSKQSIQPSSRTSTAAAVSSTTTTSGLLGFCKPNQRSNQSTSTVAELDKMNSFPDYDRHARFMRLAINEARKAPEVSSCYRVGCIIVNPSTDEILSTGYTRELHGNTHAEQNALTKLYQRFHPDFTVTATSSPPFLNLPCPVLLYTTFDPCLQRLSGHKSCVDRILEARLPSLTRDSRPAISRIYVGANEPDTFIPFNSGRRVLTQSGIEWIQFPGFEREILDIATSAHPPS